MNFGDEVHARHDDAGDLVVVDLVVDARERDRELVVRERDVREVRVVARHDLGREVDVDVPLGLVVVSHCRTSIAACGSSSSPSADCAPPYVDDVAALPASCSRRHARVEMIEVREEEQVAARIPERAFVSLLDARGRAVRLDGLQPLPRGRAARPAATSASSSAGRSAWSSTTSTTASRSAR